MSHDVEPRVVVAILNWNNLPDTIECVQSVLSSDYRWLSVWVVDNGSEPDLSAVIRGTFPNVRLIRNTENLGYGGGNNVALRLALAEQVAYVLILNNDAVLQVDTVRQLVAAMEAVPSIGMATPRVLQYEPPDRVYWDGGAINWRTGEVPHNSAGLPRRRGLIYSEWLDGCALFVRVETIRQIGLLDERYFLYYEDADWSVRAARGGWENVVVEAATARHKVSRSAGRYGGPLASFYYTRNRYLFLLAHGPLGRHRVPLSSYARIAYGDYVRLLGRRESRLAVIAACWSLLRRQSGPRTSRPVAPLFIVDFVVFWPTVVARAIRRLVRAIRPMAFHS